VLYLSEVKNQSRAFMGGYKTELKLLASQASDQTWNTIGGEDIIATDAIVEQTGKGTLYIVNLDDSKEIQGTPELAGSRIVNYLRHFSRTLKKSQSQELEIEEWKTSLKIQGEEIARRQGELDRQEQTLQQQQTELARLEEEKNKLAGAWEQLREEKSRLDDSSVNQGEIKQKLETVLARFTEDNSLNPHDFRQNCQQALSSVENQQAKLDEYWQELEANKHIIEQKQQELQQQKQDLQQSRQELIAEQNNLQQAKLELQLQQSQLREKEESVKQLNLYLEGIERLSQEIAIVSDDDDNEHKLDLNALETMPLGDLEEIVSNLQQETSKVVNFVNMQEEELTLQKEEVKALEAKIASANEIDKLSLDSELADAQEAMKLLNETLVGQRRNLKKQQQILNQHFQILSRRKGVADVEFIETINLQPIIEEVESQNSLFLDQKNKINAEINHLSQSLNQNAQKVEHLEQEYQQKEQQWQQDEENWQQSNNYVREIQTKIDFLGGSLHPIQEQLHQIRHHLQTIESSINQLENSLNQQNEVLTELNTMI
jgi:chromosome segregation ATPase